MLKYFSLPLLLVVSLALLSPRLSSPAQKNLPPLPTQVRFTSETEEEERRGFKEWYENMHRTAPGIDWRSIERKNQLERYARRRLAGINKTQVTDTLANGNLIGEWRERGSSNQSGRMHVAFMDTTNNLIYAGSSGGNVWRGNANGTGWVSLNDDLQFDGISLIRQLPNGTNTRLVAGTTGKDFWYSDDDGATWNAASGLSGVQSWGWIPRTIVAADSRHTIYLLAVEWDYVNWNAETSIYRSIDLGSSFTKITSWGEPAEGNSDHFDLFTPVMGDSTVYLLHSGEVSTLNYSTGLPDSLSSFALNNDGYTMLTGQVIGGSTNLFAYVDQDIYKSADGGATWNFISNIGKNPFFRTSFSASVTQPDVLWFGDVECWRSTDAGANWTKTNDWWAYYPAPATKLHADIPSIIPFIDSGGAEKQFISTDGGLYISADNAVTVSNLSLSGLNVGQYYSTYTHRNAPEYIYVGTQDQGFQRASSDPGGILPFTQVISGDYGHIVSGNLGNSIWMVYPGFADYYSYAPTGNNTAQWNFQNIPLWLPPLLEHETDASKCYLAGGYTTTSGSHILLLSHNGNSVTATELPYDFKATSGADIGAMEYSRIDNNHWYVLTTNGKFYHSNDGGSTFSQNIGFTGPESHYFYGSDIYASKLTPGLVYIAGSGYSSTGFFRSTNHGATFTAADSGLAPTLIFEIAANHDESLIFAATEAGPYVYVVAEDRWYDMTGSSAPDQTYWTVDYVEATNTARFGTYGRGIWDFAITHPVITSTAKPGENSISLWPNPASDFIHLEIHSPADEQVSIRFTDVSGKVHPAGIFNLSSGAAVSIPVGLLPSGVYFCEVRGRNFREARKVVVQ